MSTKPTTLKKTGIRLFLILALLIVLVGIQAVFADNEPLPVRDTFNGRYDIIAAGQGLDVASPGSVNITIPATATDVAAAYLYWAGSDDDDDGVAGPPIVAGDDTVTLVVNMGADQIITADTTYGPELEDRSLTPPADPNAYVYSLVYFEDITSLVPSPGNYTFTLTDFELDFGIEYGFGVLVVYEDPNLNIAEVSVRDGLDYLFWQYDDPSDSPSGLNCMTFTAHGASTRVMDATMFAAGVTDEFNTNRPNNLYYQTGSGSPPTGEIISTGTVINTPFASSDDFQWDTYQTRIEIGPTDTYACFQIESVNSLSPLGASVLWMMGGFALKNETPTAVNLVNLGANDQAGLLPVLGLAGVLLTFASIAVVYRKKQRS